MAGVVRIAVGLGLATVCKLAAIGRNKTNNTSATSHTKHTSNHQQSQNI